MAFSEPAPLVSTALRLADDQADFHPREDEPQHELAVVERVSLDRHPVGVYLGCSRDTCKSRPQRHAMAFCCSDGTSSGNGVIRSASNGSGAVTVNT